MTGLINGNYMLASASRLKKGQEGAVNKELQMYIGKLNRTFCLLHRNFPKLEA